MLGNRKLVLDPFCEVHDLLQPYADAEVWNLEEHIAQGLLIPNAVYVLGCQRLQISLASIRKLVTDNTITVIFSNPAEGSETLKGHIVKYGIEDLVLAGKIAVIGGGDMDLSYKCLQYDSFLPKILDYTENVAEIARTPKIYAKDNKPYKFLFLNGRHRPHRKQLIDHFRSTGLLDSAIWTCLDKRTGPIQYLDPKYEYGDYQQQVGLPSTEGFVKNQLFNNTWGEIYLKAEPYIDTYFSLVSETVFDYPYSFRTEKIWKPIAMGHPFIAVANKGYYRDLHNLGFKTFGNIIDENFDSIDNNEDRLARIIQVVEDLCQQDLASFLNECYNVCKYNQQYLAGMSRQVRKEFPDRFQNFIQHNL